MVMVHKFLEREEALPLTVAEALGRYGTPPKAETFGVVNPSERILLMIDEAHRTQSSDLGDNLFEAFPNATRIAFTGTPLITERHGTKRTVKRFGEYIDTYKLMDAVHDGATLADPLRRPHRGHGAAQDKHGFDAKFEDLFRGPHARRNFSPSKRSTARPATFWRPRSVSARSPATWSTTTSTTSCPDGFKAQVVCHSKLAAIRYQKAMREALAERLDSEKRQGQAGSRADPAHRLPEGGGGRFLRCHQRARGHHGGAQRGAKAGMRSRTSASRSTSTIRRRTLTGIAFLDRLRHAAHRLRCARSSR